MRKRNLLSRSTVTQQGEVHPISAGSGPLATAASIGRALATVLVLLVCLLSRPSLADSINWQGATGDWFNANNWIDYSRIDGQGHYLNLVPTAADVTEVANGGTPQVNGTAATNQLGLDNGSALSVYGGSLAIGSNLLIANQSGSASFSLSNGSLTAPYEYVGFQGSGSFTQTGGTNTVATKMVIAYNGVGGTYQLNGGNLNAATIEMGSGATFTQTGGTLAFGTFNQTSGGSVSIPTLVLGTGGNGTTYNQYNGNLTTTTLALGSGGTFTQSGGNNMIGSNLLIANQSGSASFSLSNGSLTAPYEYVGFQGSGSFTQTGGTNTVATKMVIAYNGVGGTYQLNGGNLNAATIEMGSGATFTQTGGTLAFGTFNQTSGGSVSIPTLVLGTGGNGTTYNQYNGNLTTTTLALGSGGTFTQSGGNNTIGSNLLIANQSGSASFSLSNGSLTALYEYVGFQGSGSFTQTGGTNTVATKMVIAYNGVGGTYQLNGGNLNAATIEMGSGATFTQTGGTLAFGTFNQTSGGSMSIPTLVLGTGGNGTTYNQYNGSVNTGTVTVSSGGVYSLQGGTLTAGAVVINSGGTFTNSAAVTLTGASVSTTLNGGTFTQNPSGSLTVQINGTSNGQFGQIVVGTASLAGRLNVTLGSNYTDFTLPAHSDTFQIVSSSNPTIGTFNSGKSVVQAKFSGTFDPYKNGGSAGLFNVNYLGTNGAALTSFHQVYVLSYGLTDQISGETLNGGLGAQQVHDAFAKLPGVVDNALDNKNVISTTNTVNVAQDLTTQVNSIADKVHAGDTFVFYINTHGTFGTNPANTGGEAPVYRQTTDTQNYPDGTEPSTQQTELYLSYGDSTQNLTATQFANIFKNNTKWQGVNKLFVMDTCYSGGFWSNPGGDGYAAVKYLAGLDHCAIISGAPENLFAYESPTGEGALGVGLAQALSSFSDTDLSFDALCTQVHVTVDSLFEQQSGWAYESPITGISNILVIPSDGIVSFPTSDFTLGMVGEVPEPSSLSLLALGAIALLRRRRAA